MHLLSQQFVNFSQTQILARGYHTFQFDFKVQIDFGQKRFFFLFLAQTAYEQQAVLF